MLRMTSRISGERVRASRAVVPRVEPGAGGVLPRVEPDIGAFRFDEEVELACPAAGAGGVVERAKVVQHPGHAEAGLLGGLAPQRLQKRLARLHPAGVLGVAGKEVVPERTDQQDLPAGSDRRAHGLLLYPVAAGVGVQIRDERGERGIQGRTGQGASGGQNVRVRRPPSSISPVRRNPPPRPARRTGRASPPVRGSASARPSISAKNPRGCGNSSMARLIVPRASRNDARYFFEEHAVLREADPRRVVVIQPGDPLDVERFSEQPEQLGLPGRRLVSRPPRTLPAPG
jgi:hypothetical protein